MKWEDERYARLYTRDTTNWVMGPWEARAVLPSALRKMDRAGHLDLGEDGLEGLAALVRLPLDVVEAGMAWWFKKGTFEMRGTMLVMTNYRPAQEAKASARKRAKEKRERDASRECDPPRDGSSRCVTKQSQVVTERNDIMTPSHTTSHRVTPSLAEPSRADLLPSGLEISEIERDPDRSTAAASEANALVAAPASPTANGKLPDWVFNFERKAWVEAYEQAVTTARGGKSRWVLNEKTIGSLRKVVEAHCLGEDRKNIPDWIARDVAEFVRAVLVELNEDPKRWSGLNADGLLEWHNRERPGYVPPRPSGVVLVSARPPAEAPATPAQAAEAQAKILSIMDRFGRGQGAGGGR